MKLCEISRPVEHRELLADEKMVQVLEHSFAHPGRDVEPNAFSLIRPRHHKGEQVSHEFGFGGGQECLTPRTRL